MNYNELMENLREIVSKNLVDIRKQNGLTQVELGKKLNYSDKAISRWEKGEVLPDLETLQTISKIYGVSISYFFETHNNPAEQKQTIIKKVAIDFLALCAVWTLFTVMFVYLLLNHNIIFWQAFVWCVPITICCLIVSWWKAPKPMWLSILLNSLLLWTFVASVYLQFIQYDLWVLFIVGVPVQATIITAALFKKSKNIRLPILKSKKTEKKQ